MIKAPSTEESDKLVIEVIEKHLLHYTIQFFHKTDDGLKPYASGVLALIHDTHFILTASHVADFLIEYEQNQLYIRIDKNRYINVLGHVNVTDIDKSKRIDLAYIKIDPEMVPDLLRPYQFIKIDKIAAHDARLSGNNYCVIGFPEKNFSISKNIINTGANFYLTNASNEKVYEYYKLSMKDFFILDMKGKGTDISTGKPSKIDDQFYGISGCGLWFLIFNNNPTTGELSLDYRLIGIMTEFRKGKYYCLIGNKIRLILNAMTAIDGLKFVERQITR